MNVLINIRTEIVLAKYTGRIWKAGGQNSQTPQNSEPGEATTECRPDPWLWSLGVKVTSVL